MDSKIQAALRAMADYETGCPKRIQHLIKVYTFSQLIALGEGLDPHTQLVLEAAAVVHDIGIRKAEERFGSCTGKLQEELGPPEAERLLTELRFPPEVIDRVCWLVGHHHTYTDIQGLDYRILVEADFLVNLYEKSEPLEAQRAAWETIFRTETGRRLFRAHFPAACPEAAD